MKKMCSACKQEQPYKVRTEEVTLNVWNKDILVNQENHYCEECGQWMYDKDLMNQNLQAAFEQYNSLFGVSTTEIKRVREEVYQLPIGLTAQILGINEIALQKIEKGTAQPPDVIPNLKKLLKPEAFYQLYKANEKNVMEFDRTFVEHKLHSVLHPQQMN